MIKMRWTREGKMSLIIEKGKKMKIAICDDDLAFLQELSTCLKQYGNEHNCEIVYETFTNPLELVARIEKGIHYDVILLDIYMPGINGIQCAKDIRNYDSYVEIIFLTSSTEFAIDSYSVRAYHYLLKPLRQESLFLLLDQLTAEIKAREKNILIVKCKNGLVKISLSKLEYCEVINRKIMLHLTNGEEYESGSRMNELEEKLQDFGMFLRPHRSFLINMDYIHTLTTQSIIMESGVKIPVPREKYTQIKKIYMEYVFQTATLMI